MRSVRGTNNHCPSMQHPYIPLLMVALATARIAQAQQPGDLDSTFHADGISTTDFAGSTDSGNAMALQPDGKVVVAGSAADQGYVIALARYLPNGEIDTGFGINGKVTT